MAILDPNLFSFAELSARGAGQHVPSDRSPSLRLSPSAVVAAAPLQDRGAHPLAQNQPTGGFRGVEGHTQPSPIAATVPFPFYFLILIRGWAR